LLWLGAGAFLVVIPFLIWGYPFGAHDIYFHLLSWLDAALQIRSGAIFPRWAVLANYGYGEPRFIFYPPLSWLLGGFLSIVLPWKIVPGVFVWLVLTGAAASMYLLSREWLPANVAMLAALVYMANPYQLMVVYWRFAAAELMASALFPLLLLFALRLGENRGPAVVPLAVALAAIWLTNAPSAVIASYSLAILLLAMAVQRRSFRPLLLGGMAAGLGLALAASYIIPAAWEQKWVHIQSALAPWVRPENNFVTWTAPPKLTAPPNWRFKGAAAANIALSLAVVLIAALRRRQLPRLWSSLAVLGVFASLFMFPVSLPLWQHLPKLRFVQLPWRWLFVENAIATFLFAAIFYRLGRKARIVAVVFVVGLLGVMLGVARIKHGAPGRVDQVRASVERDDGYLGVLEYTPVEVELPAKSGYAVFSSKAITAPLRVSKSFQGGAVVMKARAAEAGNLRLPLYWYPAWRADVNGVAVPVGDDHGQLVVPLFPGENSIVLRLTRTPDCIIGNAISALGLLIVVVVTAGTRRRTHEYCHHKGTGTEESGDRVIR
jgi:hypothetical protein